MSEVIDGQGTKFRVDDVEVGGVNTYRFFEGQTPQVAWRSLCDKHTRYVSGQVDHGTATIALFRNLADPGQQMLAAAKANRKTLQCEIELESGYKLQFEALCTSLPLIGGKRNGQTILTSNCQLKLSGPVTPA